MDETKVIDGSDAMPAARGRFWLRRIHSLSGAVPLGLFLALHLWTNAEAVAGRDAFRASVRGIQSLPALPVLEWAGIFAPLAFHATYGMVIAFRSSANVRDYGYTSNWLYVLQRVSGVTAFAFVVLHLGQFRVAKALGTLDSAAFYDRLAALAGAPAMFAVYVAGVTACVFHFANGLWTAGQTWGLAVSPVARRRSAWACAALGLVLWAGGLNTLLHFYARCGGVLPLPAATRMAACRDGDLSRRATPALPAG